jgi:hypothetical protein
MIKQTTFIYCMYDIRLFLVIELNSFRFSKNKKLKLECSKLIHAILKPFEGEAGYLCYS